MLMRVTFVTKKNRSHFAKLTSKKYLRMVLQSFYPFLKGAFTRNEIQPNKKG